MKLEVKDGRVIFNGQELKDANLELQIKSNELMSKVDNDYTLNELIEMTKAKGRQVGIDIDFIIENKR